MKRTNLWWGDKVKIVATRPLSKLKRWRVLEIIEKAPVA
jgi:small subunit ribosomal protein S17